MTDAGAPVVGRRRPPTALDLDAMDGILARHPLPAQPGHTLPIFLLPTAPGLQVEAPDESPTAVRAPAVAPAAVAVPSPPPAAPLPVAAPAPPPVVAAPAPQPPARAPVSAPPPPEAPELPVAAVGAGFGLVAVGAAAVLALLLVGGGAWWWSQRATHAPDAAEPPPSPPAEAPIAALPPPAPVAPEAPTAEVTTPAPPETTPPAPTPLAATPAATPEPVPAAPEPPAPSDRSWTVRFAYGSVEPMQRTAPAWVRSCHRLQIVGHTDGAGSAEVNERIGLGRAIATRRLVGDDEARRADSIQSAGSTAPLADNSTPEGRRQNRRAEVHCLEP